MWLMHHVYGGASGDGASGDGASGDGFILTISMYIAHRTGPMHTRRRVAVISVDVTILTSVTHNTATEVVVDGVL